MFEQTQQGVGIRRPVDEADGEVDQPARVHARQRLAGRDVGDHAPALQPGGDAAAEGEVGRDEGAGPARGFERLAHHQGEGGGGVFLGPHSDDRQAFEPFGDRIGGPVPEGVGAQGADDGAPVVGGVGRTQGLVDQPLAGAAARRRPGVFRGLEPRAHGVALGAAVEQPPEGILGVLLVIAEGRPDGRVQLAVEPGQDDAAARRGGHGGEHIGGGGGGAGRAGGDDGLGRWALGPGIGQKAQQPGAAPGRVDHPHGLQPLRPGLDGEGEKFGRLAPVLGQVALDQGRDPVQVRDLLELAGIEEAAEGVGHLQRAQGRQAGAEVLDDHPRHLEATGQGGDGRRQVEAELPGGEGRLVLFEVAEGTDLGQQDRTAAGLFAQGGSEGAGGAAVGQQDDGVGQDFGRTVAQPVQYPGGEILEEGPPGLDGIPARDILFPMVTRAVGDCLRDVGERIEAGAHPPPSFASAWSRACGSPTCIQSPSSTQP